MCHTVPVARLTRSESKARTRRRLIAEAERLFVEKGYAATSLEQVARAAEVTKGAIYGHFANKEELLLSAIESASPPSFPELLDDARPVRERLEEFGRRAATSDGESDPRQFAAWLEFLAALLRNDDARSRYGANVLRLLSQYAEADPVQPVEGTSALEVWLIGTALSAGLQLYGVLLPELFDADLRAKAVSLLAGFYEETDQ